MATLQANRTLTGSFAEVWVDGARIAELSELTLNVKILREKVQLGMDVDTKITGYEGSGTMVLKQVYTRFFEVLEQAKAGIDKRCADCTWDEVKDLDVGSWKGKEWANERPCLFEDILALAREGRFIEVDVKAGPEIVPAIRRLVESQTNATPRNLVFASARSETIAALRAAMPDFQAWMGVTCRRGWGKNYPPRPVKEALEIVRRSKATGVALQFDPAIVTADYIAAFHRAGYYVNVWTIDDAKSALLAIERGADTVTSNRPGKLLEESQLRQ